MCVRDSLSMCMAAVCACGRRCVGCDCCLLSHLVAFLERGQFVWKLVEHGVFLNLQTATRNADRGEKPCWEVRALGWLDGVGGGRFQMIYFASVGSLCNSIKRDYVCVVKYQTVLNVILYIKNTLSPFKKRKHQKKKEKSNPTKPHKMVMREIKINHYVRP